ncbi:MAG: SGNH/GDSL hydrolase family protein, partial [Chloroflexi bacterium]
TASACALQTIRDFAAAVRATHANTQIAIAYIAADRVIWAPRADDATDHDREVHAQQTNAAVLAKLAGELNIKFIDPTAELRQHALTEMLYHQGLHFNSYGYSLYAAFLARELAPVLILP